MKLNGPTGGEGWGPSPADELAWVAANRTPAEEHRSDTVLRMRRYWTETATDPAPLEMFETTIQ
ncbi:MAG: hypothetical protein WKF93_10235, partial [Acidimicrobiales bacterium]